MMAKNTTQKTNDLAARVHITTGVKVITVVVKITYILKLCNELLYLTNSERV